MENKIKEEVMNLESFNTFHCEMPVQLRYSDCDMQGHVNNSVYLSLFDVAKIEYLSKVKGDNVNWGDVSVVVASVKLDYSSPTRFNENVVIKTRCAAVGNKSLSFIQQLAEKESGEIKCTCHTVMVYIDRKKGETAPVPEFWRKALKEFERW